MYYPYLRARQFELIALRELAAEDSTLSEYVTPVLEPVRVNFNNFDIAHRVFAEHNFSAYIIVNPQVGELAGNHDTVLEYLKDPELEKFMPAFIYANNKEYIEQSINKYNLYNCMLIGYGNFANESDFRSLCENPRVRQIMVLEPQRNRSLNSFIKELDKTYIRLDDLFEKETKNADYLDIPAHRFSEEHRFYKKDGYKGFSDFTLLPGEHIEGGWTPWAVAIHLSYIKPKDEDNLWIRHFTSETNDTKSNVQGKFAEAAAKAVEFCESEGLDNSAIAELKLAYYDAKYPGLGVVKKISIKNHIITIKNYLHESKSTESM